MNEKIIYLRKCFEKDIEFNRGFPDQLVDAILDKITVERLDDSGLANLEVFLKIGLKVDILYKKKKIFKYIEKQNIAS